MGCTRFELCQAHKDPMNTMHTTSPSTNPCLGISRRRWTIPLLLFLVALAAGSIFQGSRGLYDRDETRYAECAREMLETRNFLVPQRDFRPHLTKPPMTYWAIAAGMKIFGKNEWGVRSPNALAFALTVLLVALIGRLLCDKDQGLMAGVVYMSMIFPFAASSIVTTDTLLVLWEVAAIWAFLAGYKSNTPSQATRWFVLMYIFWALGFLTKGVAILPVASAPVIFWLLNRRKFVKSPLTYTGMLLFTLLGMGWYIVLALSHPGAFSVFVNEQIIGRLFSNSLHRNSAWYAPFYLYLPILLLGPLPWSLLWPAMIKNIPPGHNGNRRNIDTRRNHAVAAIRRIHATIIEALRNKSGLQLIALWWAIPLIIFCLARSRLPLYILPLFAPMALVTVMGLEYLPGRIKGLCKPTHGYTPLIAPCPIFLWMVFLIVLKGASATVTMPQNARTLYEKVASHLTKSTLILADCDLNLDGLAFYSGKNIEYLAKDDTSCQRTDDTWANEMAEMAKDGTPRIFIIPLDEPYALSPKGSSKGIPGGITGTNLPNDMYMVYVPALAPKRVTDNDLAMDNIRGWNSIMVSGEQVSKQHMRY